MKVKVAKNVMVEWIPWSKWLLHSNTISTLKDQILPFTLYRPKSKPLELEIEPLTVWSGVCYRVSPGSACCIECIALLFSQQATLQTIVVFRPVCKSSTVYDKVKIGMTVGSKEC